MATTITRDDPLLASSSSPITVSASSSSSAPLDSFLSADPSASAGSFQNDGLLSDSSYAAATAAALDAEFGFSRPDFGAEPFAGTVDPYDRHVFLCYKNPRVWPPRVEAAEFDRLPRLLSAAVSARKPDMKRETRLTICEGHDGTETSNGDVLLFPDMVRYRRLTHFDVDTFVEEVLVKDSDWLPMTPETLKGSYIFVCCHGSRDRRCGVCGPALVTRFQDEIELHGLIGKVSVSPCSHIGGHKYAGNVIIFGPNSHGEVTGHWYGYVTPDDVTELLELHIGKGEIVDRLWRGQMGLSEEEQKESQNQRLRMNGETNIGKDAKELAQSQRSLSNASTSRSEAKVMGCCQEHGDSSCCQNPALPQQTPSSSTNGVSKKPTADKKKSSRKLLSRINSGKGSSTRRVCSMPTWLESWEREDTYAALAVACAAVSVAVAYSCYKQLR